MNCRCGKTAQFFSALLEEIFCSTECYEKARGITNVKATKYVGHGQYENTHLTDCNP